MERLFPALTRRNFLRSSALTLPMLAAACGIRISPPNNTYGNLPLRSIAEAIEVTTQRLILAQAAQPIYEPSPLEIALRSSQTNQQESTYGLVSEDILEEREKPKRLLGSFIFAFKPWNPTFESNGQLVPLFANTPHFADFRKDGEALTRVADRTIYSIYTGQKVTAVIETDMFDQDNFASGIRLLLSYGVRRFIVGNEPNREGATEADTPKVILKVAHLVWQEAKAMHISNMHVATPGLAHYGDFEYLEELVSAAGGSFPFNEISDHNYGSVEGFPGRIRFLGWKAEQLGIGHYPKEIKETGNPTDLYKEEVTDKDLAEGGVVLKLLLGRATRQVNAIYWYSTLDWGRPDHSLMRAENGGLYPKDTYLAYRVAEALDQGIIEEEIIHEKDTLAVKVRRRDRITFTAIGSKLEGDKIIKYALQAGQKPYNTKGQPTGEVGFVELRPKVKDYLIGPEKILVTFP